MGFSFLIAFSLHSSLETDVIIAICILNTQIMYFQKKLAIKRQQVESFQKHYGNKISSLNPTSKHKKDLILFLQNDEN